MKLHHHPRVCVREREGAGNKLDLCTGEMCMLVFAYKEEYMFPPLDRCACDSDDVRVGAHIRERTVMCSGSPPMFSHFSNSAPPLNREPDNLLRLLPHLPPCAPHPPPSLSVRSAVSPTAVTSGLSGCTVPARDVLLPHARGSTPT